MSARGLQSRVRSRIAYIYRMYVRMWHTRAYV